MALRFTTHGSKGYSLLAVDGDDVEGPHSRFVAVHRLAAVGWDVLDGLDDPREVDHIEEVPWWNAKQNCQALDSVEHGRKTRERAADRRAEA